MATVGTVLTQAAFAAKATLLYFRMAKAAMAVAAASGLGFRASVKGEFSSQAFRAGPAGG